MGAKPDLGRLQEPLYAAITDDGKWSEFLDELGRQCEGDVAVLFAHDYQRGAVPFFVSRGIDTRLERDYTTRLGPMNPWVAEQEGMSEGSVVLSHRLKSDATICRSEYFADFMRPLGVRHAVGSNILKSDGCVVKMGVMRSSRRGMLGAREAQLFTALMPSLQSAFRLRGKLETLNARTRIDWQVLECLPTGVILLDSRGAIVYMNGSAEDTVRQNDGLLLTSDGRLTAASEVDRRWLEQVIANGGNTAALRTLHRPSGKRGLSVRLQCVSHSPLALGHSASIAVFVGESDRVGPGLDGRLVALFGLTPSEARLAACLVQGLTLAEAAGRLRISEGTARFVSKRVFAKSATRGQAEFVRVVLTGVASVGSVRPREHALDLAPEFRSA